MNLRVWFWYALKVLLPAQNIQIKSLVIFKKIHKVQSPDPKAVSFCPDLFGSNI